MYENMVKEAYENIVGVEKEAAFDGIKAKLSTGARRRKEDAVERTKNRVAHENRLHSRAYGVHRHNKRKAQEQAEKAAAYYDEAQLVKEAAETDYNEACAYEDAALEVLAELGYDVDELCKEAGVKDVAGTACGAVKNFGKGYVDALKGTGIREGLADRAHMKEVGIDAKNALAIVRKKSGSLPKDIAKTVGAYALPIAAIGGATAYGVHRHNKRKAQEQAEKAAAYYDEAQLVKEAAETDYNEACAYEDAALEVLAELGYDVDELCKEAKE